MTQTEERNHDATVFIFCIEERWPYLGLIVRAAYVGEPIRL